MPTRSDLRAALRNPNVQAFLRVIREGETGQGDDAYRTLYGGGRFDSFEAHPRRAVTAAGLTSTAAGAYQFLSRTWDGLVRQYGFENFGPACQDEAAVALIAGRKALNAILDGDLASTLERCSWEWASLPPSRYGQHAMTAERVYATYDRWGGRYGPAEAPPEPAPDVAAAPAAAVPFATLPLEDSMVAPLLATAAASVAPAVIKAVLPALVGAIPALGKLFGSGSEVSERNLRAAEIVGNIVVDAVGASNVQEAAERVTNDPRAAQAAREAVTARWYELVESGGGGIEGARQASIEAASVPLFKQPAVVISLSLLPLIYMTVGAVLFHVGFSDEVKTMVVSLVAGGTLGAIASFFLGSSFTTSRTRGLGATPAEPPR